MAKEEALSKKLEELCIPRDLISNLPLNGLIFNAERRFNRYEMYDPGDTFEGRLLRWLSNFSPEDRCVAINLVKYIQYVSRNELRALVEFVLDLASTFSWHSVIQSYTSKSEVSWNDAFNREIKRNIFVAVSDDISFDYFRRQGRRRFPQLEKENFVEYYKMGETDIKDIEDNVGSLKHFFLLDQFCGSGTSALRFEGREHESKGKLRGFFNRWRPVIANADVYYVPLIASSLVKSVLQERLDQITGDVTGIAEVNILPLLVVPPSEWLIHTIDGKQSIDESTIKLLEKYYSRFKEDKHTQKGRGCLLGLGAGGLSLIIGTNCPNNSLYFIWHSDNKWYPLFPRIAHHRKTIPPFDDTDSEEQKDTFKKNCQRPVSLSAISRCTIVELKDIPTVNFDLAASIDPESQDYKDLQKLIEPNWVILQSFYSEESINKAATKVPKESIEESMALEFRIVHEQSSPSGNNSKQSKNKSESVLIVPFLSVSGPTLSPPSTTLSEDTIIIPALMFPLSGNNSLDSLLSMHAEYIDESHVRTEKMLYLPAESPAIAFHRTAALLESYRENRGIDYERIYLIPGYDTTSMLVVTAIAGIWNINIQVQESLKTTPTNENKNLILARKRTPGDKNEV
ncbi:MAG TPA: hypothetical protein EYP28_03290 [Methanophagales archaeon]|nr:hypothetical protein [Methanophagales archaeon]